MMMPLFFPYVQADSIESYCYGHVGLMKPNWLSWFSPRCGLIFLSVGARRKSMKTSKLKLRTLMHFRRNIVILQCLVFLHVNYFSKLLG